MNREQYIDVAIRYINDKGAHYLAREDRVVYWASPTGRKSDMKWFKYSMTETCRIITTTRLGTNQDGLNSRHLLSAFQELDEVYEFGVSSAHETSEHIFNFMAHQGDSFLLRSAMIMAQRFDEIGNDMITYASANRVLREVCRKLKIDATSAELNDAMLMSFGGAGYSLRSGNNRISIDGTKYTAYVKPGEIKNISGLSNVSEAVQDIVRKIG